MEKELYVKLFCLLCHVFLIGYGAVTGFNVGDQKPPNCYVPKDGTVARIRYSKLKKFKDAD
jgi:hypothetical protein